jgi:purine-nucleoside phosphorylase
MNDRALADQVVEASDQVRHWLGGRRPQLAIVLGSAFGGFADWCVGNKRLDYAAVPHMPLPTVQGHRGQLVSGSIEGLDVLVLAGRVHVYEGYSAAQVGFGVRLAAQVGAGTLLLTNAAGALHPDYLPGDLMVIDDHINLTGDNALRGPADSRLGQRFIDCTEIYTPELRDLLDSVAASLRIELHHGIYAGLMGPSYETPAEVRVLQSTGAHAVGMSTVHEAVVAHQLGLRVAAISCITNAAAGRSGGPVTHEEVLEVAARTLDRFGVLIEGFCRELMQ